MDTLTKEEVVSAKRGVIVVRYTVCDSYGEPVPHFIQPYGRFIVIDTNGPPQVLAQTDSLDEAWGFVNERADLVPAQQPLPKEFLSKAFAPGVAGDPPIGDLHGSIDIVGEDGEPTEDQFENRWVTASEHGDGKDMTGLTILAGYPSLKSLNEALAASTSASLAKPHESRYRRS